MKSAIQPRLVLFLLLLTACSGCVQKPRNPDELKEKTAETTSNLKRDAKAVAEGIREGWSRDRPLDINSASKDQLMSLPGMSPADADRVIGSRPYDAPKDLLDRHILPKDQYDRISDRIVAKK